MKIIQNAIKIGDKILNSTHAHDYQEFDGYIIDGGKDYFRYGGKAFQLFPNFEGEKDPSLEDLRLDTTSTIEEIKSKLLWGSRGKDNKQPLEYKKLCEIDDDYLVSLYSYVKDRNNVNPLHKYIISLLYEDKFEFDNIN